MSRAPLSPGLIIIAMTTLIAVSAGVILWLSASTPWLGVGLVPRDGLVVLEGPAWGLEAGTEILSITAADGKRHTIEAQDLLAEPDSLSTYAGINALYDRQQVLFDLIGGPVIAIEVRTDAGLQTLDIAPAPRPLGSLPGSFWIQFVTGITSALIAFWVWSLRPRLLAPTLFALSGLGVLMVTLSSAYYAHRGLALPADAFRVLMLINHFGILAFSSGMIGLFLVYPRRLVHPRWLWLVPALLGPPFVLDSLQILIEAGHYYLLVMAITLSIMALIVAQYWATRRHPDERAVLGWLGLSVAIAIGSFALMSVTPALLGYDTPLSQHYAAGGIIIIYLGLALGLRRYRLFELGHWAYRILFYMLGVFALIALDAALLVGLGVGEAPALALSLLLIGLIYLPLRDWVWRRFFAPRHIEEHELFSAAMAVAFAPSRVDSARRWRDLLARLFDPLQAIDHTNDLNAPSVSEDGLTMTLPAVAGAPGLRLSHPFGGRGLFQPGHLALAANLVTLTERAEESRQAYMRGVGEERRRMARDLHDDVGARLLTGLHTADERTRPTLQAALSDIRAIVSGLAGDEAELDRVLAQIRHEAARRLEAAEIGLDWPLVDALGVAADIRIDYRAHKALTSATREIVSNVIRHSGADTLTVALECTPENLVLRFADNGRGLPATALAGETTGYGLRNLRQRLADLGGSVAFGTTGGTTITLALPLHLAEPPEPGVKFPHSAVDLPS